MKSRSRAIIIYYIRILYIYIYKRVALNPHTSAENTPLQTEREKHKHN